uniref:Uncharacterized protein n=1 Tax=Arundo donax TaxID=35708 RepID=A0A0A9AE97_ARUDO
MNETTTMKFHVGHGLLEISREHPS